MWQSVAAILTWALMTAAVQAGGGDQAIRDRDGRTVGVITADPVSGDRVIRGRDGHTIGTIRRHPISGDYQIHGRNGRSIGTLDTRD